MLNCEFGPTKNIPLRETACFYVFCVRLGCYDPCALWYRGFLVAGVKFFPSWWRFIVACVISRERIGAGFLNLA